MKTAGLPISEMPFGPAGASQQRPLQAFSIHFTGLKAHPVNLPLTKKGWILIRSNSRTRAEVEIGELKRHSQLWA
jgi:hypothetical protein